MKTNPFTFAGFVLAAFLLASVAAIAGDISHEGHASHGSHGSAAPATGGHGDHNSMDHSQHEGKNIRNAEVNGYKLAYHLIDMQQKVAPMKDSAKTSIPEMKSHHLMVYIKAADGKSVTDAQTGYLVVGPDGKIQKAMAMAMGGGYGADLDFKHGAYSIKTKIMIGGNKLMDEFTFSAH